MSPYLSELRRSAMDKAGQQQVQKKPTSTSNIDAIIAKYKGLQPSAIASVLSFLFYSSLVVFIIFVVLMIIHYTVYPVFKFNANDTGLIPMPTATDKKAYSTKAVVSPATPIMDGGAALPDCQYSLSFDLFIPSVLSPLHLPRVILYRGTGQIATSVSAANPTIDMLIEINKYPATNFILWLHPTLNDLYFTAIVKGAKTDPNTKVSLRSRPIQNLPNNQPIRVTFVYTRLFVELYVNGKLKETMVIPPGATPIALESATGNYLFGTPLFGDGVSRNAQIANIEVWDRAITAREAEENGRPIADATLFNKV